MTVTVFQSLLVKIWAIEDSPLIHDEPFFVFAVCMPPIEHPFPGKKEGIGVNLGKYPVPDHGKLP